MITIKSKNKNYGINFPTSVEEVTPTALKAVLENVNLPKYHCVIAMCSSIKLFDLVTAISGANKDTITQVIPLIGKINESDNENLNANVGERVIIDRSSLERGVHLTTAFSISSSNAMRYINSDADLKKDILSGKFNNASNGQLNKSLSLTTSPQIVLVEFKIVPVSAISATIKNDTDYVDPYKTVADC